MTDMLSSYICHISERNIFCVLSNKNISLPNIAICYHFELQKLDVDKVFSLHTDNTLKLFSAMQQSDWRRQVHFIADLEQLWAWASLLVQDKILVSPWCNYGQCGIRIPWLGFISQRVPMVKLTWAINLTIALVVYS